MKTKPRLLSVSLAAVLSVSLLAVQPASALTVFDPSNFVQNTLTAVRTLEQINNQINQLQVSLKIGDQDFKRSLRVQLFYGLNGFHPVTSTLIGQVVAVDRRNYSVFQLHQLNGFGYVCRLFRIQSQRFSGQRIAKLARTGTNFSSNHESSRTPPPAFTHVRAFTTGAYGV